MAMNQPPRYNRGPQTPTRYRDFTPRPLGPSINEPLPPKDPNAPPKFPTHEAIDMGPVFKNQRIGSFEVCFSAEGEPVKQKKSQGFLALKPRGQGTVLRYFVVRSDSTLPSKKDVIRQIEEYYSRSKDYKVAQVHYQPEE